MSQRFYSDEEAEAILRAASQKSATGGMTRDKLLETAAELGISPDAVEEAEQSVIVRAKERTLRKEFDRHHRQEFLTHLYTYLIINVFLVFLDLWTSHAGHLTWAYWPIFGWGIGIAFHFIHTFNRSGSEYQKEFDKWRDKQRRKGMSTAELAADIANEWLADHPGDARGAERHVRHEMDLRKREARVVVEKELYR